MLNVSFHPGFLCSCLAEVLPTAFSALLCKFSLQLKPLPWFTQELSVITGGVMMYGGLHQTTGMAFCSWHTLKDKSLPCWTLLL